jgi:hypothetical protein
LQALQHVDRQHTQALEHQQADGARRPALLLLSVDTGEAEERRLDPTVQGEAPRHDGLDSAGQRPGQQQDGQAGDQLHPGWRVHEKSSGSSTAIR